MLIGISGRKRSGKDSIGLALIHNFDPSTHSGILRPYDADKCSAGLPSGLCDRPRAEHFNFKRVAFADGAKALAAKVLDIPFEEAAHELFKQSNMMIVPYHHTKTGREVLQNVGNGVREVIGDDVWIKLALAKCEKAMELKGKCARCKRGADLHYWPAGHCYSANAYKEGKFINPNHYVITDVRYPNELAAIQAAGGLVLRTNRADRIDVHDFLSWPMGSGCGHTTKGHTIPGGKEGAALRICNQAREAHPTHDSGDWHPSEVSLPDTSNATIKYDAVFTGDQQHVVDAACAFVAERLK